MQGGQVSPDGFWMWDGAQWVPNPQRPVSVQPAFAPYEPAAFRATMAIVFLAANVVGVVLLGVFDVVNLSYIQQSAPSDTLTAFEGLTAILGVIAYYGSFIVAIVFFSMWVHRVVRNMPALGAPDPRWTPGGAVGRSFIPFLNLVHPMSSVLDAWRGCWPGRRWVDANARRAMPAPPLIIGWWAAWLIGGLISRVSFALTRSNDVASQVNGTYVDLFDSLVLIVAAVLAIFVVREVTARQQTKNDLISSGRLV